MGNYEDTVAAFSNTASDEVKGWISDLMAAGWIARRPTLWRAPDGRYFRGPALAWQIMKSEPGT